MGDVADLDDDTTHCPVVDSEEPCIALIATTSPAKYKSLVGKILQPFVGIEHEEAYQCLVAIFADQLALSTPNPYLFAVVN